LYAGRKFCLTSSYNGNHLILLTLVSVSDSTYDTTWTVTSWTIP
jgi:hypothetical protein